MRCSAMRLALTLLASILAVSCVPRGAIPGREGRPAAQALDADHPMTQQCRADLARERVEFRTVPDRLNENGCSVLGAVQLVDIGTPSAGLGPMKCPLARQYARWVRDILQPAARQLLGSCSAARSLGSRRSAPMPAARSTGARAPD